MSCEVRVYSQLKEKKITCWIVNLIFFINTGWQESKHIITCTDSRTHVYSYTDLYILSLKETFKQSSQK